MAASEHDVACIVPGDPVIGFWDNVERSENTVYVICGTWKLSREKHSLGDGLIRLFLGQNEVARQQNTPVLRVLNSAPRVGCQKSGPLPLMSAAGGPRKRGLRVAGGGRDSTRHALSEPPRTRSSSLRKSP